MTMISKVTVIIPVYNNKDDILNAINSVINQRYKNWELIIVDDHSKDGTYQLVNNFIKKKRDKRINLIRNMKNAGCYVSLNRGLKRASGDYITILGSDDTFHPNKLLIQANILDTEKNLVACDAYYKRQHLLSKYNDVTLMYRKNIINKIGYYDSVRFAADSEFKERIIKVFGLKRLKTIPSILYFAKIRPDSLTRSKKTGRSDIRLDYREKFKEWHRKQGCNIFMRFPIVKRPFNVNPIMLQ